jgi:hypothetical protein
MAIVILTSKYKRRRRRNIHDHGGEHHQFIKRGECKHPCPIGIEL